MSDESRGILARERVKEIFPNATLWKFDPNATRYFVTTTETLDSGMYFNDPDQSYTPWQAWSYTARCLLAHRAEYHRKDRIPNIACQQCDKE
jgi:hypothetical protein